MKVSQAEIRFPALGFTPDGDVWQFEDLKVLTTCGPRTLKHGVQVGMEIVDRDGRRWAVRSVERVGRDGSFLPWLFSALLSGAQSRIEQTLEPLPAIALDEVKRRVAAMIEADPLPFSEGDDEAAPKLAAKVRAARSIAALHPILGADDFRAY